MNRILLFFLFCLALQSCTSDDAQSLSTEGSRLRKVVLDFGNDSESIRLEYDGNKQVRQITPQSTISYHFSGNLITKLGFGNDWQHFEYDDQNRLLRTYYEEDGNDYETLFTHHSDGTVDCEEKKNGDVIETRRLYFANGELSQKDISRLNTDTQQWESATLHFTYDDQHAPDQGVGRWIFNYLKSLGKESYSMNHNVLTVSHHSNGEEVNYGYQYVYNSQGYPITMTAVSGGTTSTWVTHYFYE